MYANVNATVILDMSQYSNPSPPGTRYHILSLPGNHYPIGGGIVPVRCTSITAIPINMVPVTLYRDPSPRAPITVPALAKYETRIRIRIKKRGHGVELGIQSVESKFEELEL